MKPTALNAKSSDDKSRPSVDDSTPEERKLIEQIDQQAKRSKSTNRALKTAALMLPFVCGY